MPVHRTTSAGKPAFQWGEHGHKYPFTAGNEASEKQAESKAEAQGKAAHAHGYHDSTDDVEIQTG
jgi:hypothetical protein